MRIKCPHCDKKTITVTEKMMVGISTSVCSDCEGRFGISYLWPLVLFFFYLIISFAFDESLRLIMNQFMLVAIKLLILTVVWVFIVPVVKK